TYLTLRVRSWQAAGGTANNEGRFCEGFRMPVARRRSRALRRPASENLQGRKPRWGDVCWCRGGELRRSRTPAQLGDDGTNIAKWDLRFCLACDFKGLRVAKMSRAATST